MLEISRGIRTSAADRITAGVIVGIIVVALVGLVLVLRRAAAALKQSLHLRICGLSECAHAHCCSGAVGVVSVISFCAQRACNSTAAAAAAGNRADAQLRGRQGRDVAEEQSQRVRATGAAA